MIVQVWEVVHGRLMVEYHSWKLAYDDRDISQRRMLKLGYNLTQYRFAVRAI